MKNKTKTKAKARVAKVSRNYWESHNITREIGMFADSLGLDCLATGGNCDYIIKRLGNNNENPENEMMAVLGSAEGPECCDKLSEKCYVSIKLDSDWQKSVDIEFETARQAMRFMAGLTEVFTNNIGDLVAS